MTYVVGVTGGIGSGKTTVTDRFAEYGIVVVDADVIARGIFTPPSAALTAVIERFGEQALTADGLLNRPWLRQRVFSSPADKAWLNQLTHPLVRTELLRQLKQADSAYVILSAPLLFENGLDQLCQRTLVVDLPETEQLQRASQRDQTSAAQIKAIMAAQWSRQQRLDKADDVIDNSGPVNALDAQIQALHARYLELASAH
ncbi:dephospho-CoA kinase [Pseudidiomarina taiwanensis]|uniref:Dephospho-CoA kinase n=1 Tax=Pseudidiomarina taiwanensis TaxID=337250 RepID=A0A432ZKQ1_9GAMM|nr:dephospho-CoA kinase [Pseudidiomarina taiwanensis]RUO78519.1 dephospho-CoA kinase [Pseudidiomarina taiwanensis]